MNDSRRLVSSLSMTRRINAKFVQFPGIYMHKKRETNEMEKMEVRN